MFSKKQKIKKIILFSFLAIYPLTAFAQSLQNPLDTDDPRILIGTIIKGALGILGSLALLVFISGGFMWMLSAGNDEKVRKGKNTIIWAVLGIMVIFASYAVVNFLFGGEGFIFFLLAA